MKKQFISLALLAAFATIQPLSSYQNTKVSIQSNSSMSENSSKRKEFYRSIVKQEKVLRQEIEILQQEGQSSTRLNWKLRGLHLLSSLFSKFFPQEAEQVNVEESNN